MSLISYYVINQALNGGKAINILNKVMSYREEENRLKWEGTFADYLSIIKERPEVAQTAHSRVYNMIKSAGLEERDGQKMYQFFLVKKFLGLKQQLKDWWRSISILQHEDWM